MSETWIEKYSLTGWRGYAFSILVTLMCAMLGASIRMAVQTSVPFAAFVISLLLVALVCSRGPVLLSLLLAIVLGWFWTLSHLPVAERILSICISSVVVSIVGGMMMVMRSALLREAAAKREAEKRRDAELLSRELNHRIGNLFSVILSFVQFAGRRSDTQTNKEMLDGLREQIFALSRAHKASQGKLETDEILLGEFLGVALQPYIRADSLSGRGRIALAGSDITVPIFALTPLGLLIYELATNAIKYGALSCEDGHLDISWSMARHKITGQYWITVDWKETNIRTNLGPDGLPKSGYGTIIVNGATDQLSGTVEQSWEATSMSIAISFPQRRIIS